jgi:hypothetical protein
MGTDPCLVSRCRQAGEYVQFGRHSFVARLNAESKPRTCFTQSRVPMRRRSSIYRNTGQCLPNNRYSPQSRLIARVEAPIAPTRTIWHHRKVRQFGPLNDDRIWFSGLARRTGGRRRAGECPFATALVRWNTPDEHVTECIANVMRPWRWTRAAGNPCLPPRSRGSVDQAFAAAQVRRDGEYYVPVEHHKGVPPR